MDSFNLEDIAIISLEADLKSTLNWEKEIEEAHRSAEEGRKILWDIDFGLFDQLQYPIQSQQQFLSFGLAIEHFENTIWKQFSADTLGVCLYQGYLDFIDGISKESLGEWSRERFENLNLNSQTAFFESLYYRDVALDYLKQLAARFPFGVEIFINPKLHFEMTPTESAIFFNLECFRPLHLLNFNMRRDRVHPDSSIGICLPPISCYCPASIQLLDKSVKELSDKGSSYRFIPEESLITSIAGLDELYVVSSVISPQGKRRLQGFCAAGGQVHYL